VATRFYLRDAVSAFAPTAGEKSPLLPDGTQISATQTDYQSKSLLLTAGTSEVTHSCNVNNTTNHQDYYLGRFTSAELAAQTIAAATWTVAIGVAETNVAANTFLAPYIYVWRPSDSTVVGDIYSSLTNLGTEWSGNQQGRVVSPVGSAVTCLAGDVLVVEVWGHGTPSMASTYLQSIWFDGATVVTGSTTSDAASYIETPNNLTFAAITYTRTATFTATATTAGTAYKEVTRTAAFSATASLAGTAYKEVTRTAAFSTTADLATTGILVPAPFNFDIEMELDDEFYSGVDPSPPPAQVFERWGSVFI
jgi:hypothetical protein